MPWESARCIYPEGMAAMLWWLPPIVSVGIACLWAVSAQFRDDRAQRRNRLTRNRYRSAQLRRMGAALDKPLPVWAPGTDGQATSQRPNSATRSNCEPLP